MFIEADAKEPPRPSDTRATRLLQGLRESAFTDMTRTTSTTHEREELLRAYRETRSTTESLVEPLEPEDMVVQTMPDASPTKWHLAHTTWFFETLVLERSGEPYSTFDERYPQLFNSYYESLGNPYPREQRGLLSRPTVDEVLAYRRHVDKAMVELLSTAPEATVAEVAPTLTIGLNHEQQHQELLLMDVKQVLARNPLRPAYRSQSPTSPRPVPPMEWGTFEGGLVQVGASPDGFAYDNECPRHTVFLEPFELAPRPVTNGEYRTFMADGGYQRPELWLADGWARVQQENWRAPLYWEETAGRWRIMTLGGLRDVNPSEPVCHISYYEADAYATWSGYRLPTEHEWEHAATSSGLSTPSSPPGSFLENGTHHPTALRTAPAPGSLGQLFGDVWEWTSSAYAPYPKYQPFEGELVEYNGKFMANQLVLRGGCCITPKQHLRPTYRNFYYPHQRWMFSGLRLAR